MKPGDPEYEARLAADIARLQAAKGVNLRAWLRDNKGLAIVFGVYLLVIVAFVGFGIAAGDAPGPWLLVGIFFAPLAMLRMYLRWKR